MPHKYISPFSTSLVHFENALKNHALEIKGNKIIVKKGKLAERIVSYSLSHQQGSLIDRILNFVLHLFSKEYRQAKILVRKNFREFQKKIERRSLPLQEKRNTFPFLALPKDILQEVSSHLSKADIKSLCLSHPNFKDIYKNPYILASIIENRPQQFSLKELFHISKTCGHLVKKLNLLHINDSLKNEDMHQLVISFPKLKELQLRNCHKISVKGIEDLTQLHDLQILNLSNATGIHKGLEKIGTLLPNLQSLRITYANIHGNFNKLESLKNLHTLEFKGCEFYTDGLKKVLENTPNLKELILLEPSLEDRDINELGLLLPNLEKLTLFGNREITDLGLEKIIRSLPHLKYLKIDREFSDKSIEKITSELVNLESLHLYCGKMTDLSISYLVKNLKHLKSLSLANNSVQKNITTHALKELKSVKHLETLQLIGNFELVGVIEELALIQSLKSLHLKLNNMVSHSEAKNLALLKNLEHLDVYSEMNDTILKGIASLHNLRTLKLPFPYKGLKELAPLSKLQKLSLNCFYVNDEDMAEFPILPNLEALELSNGELIKHKGLKRLSILKKLRVLKFSGVGLHQFSVTELDACSELKGLEKLVLCCKALPDLTLLSSLRNLREFGCNDTLIVKITDGQVNQIASLQNLERINLPQLSEDQKKILQNSLPHLRICK